MNLSDNAIRHLSLLEKYCHINNQAKYPKMTPNGEHIFWVVALHWLKEKPINVKQAVKANSYQQESTNFKSIKLLEKSGWIKLEMSAIDNRVKHILPTVLALDLLNEFGIAITQIS
jgi:hypothetical protein